MGNYKLYKVKFEAEEFAEQTKMEWENQELEMIIKELIEYCNIKHNTKVVLFYRRKRK